MAVDIFYDDDRVIDDQPNRQDDAEERQRVDREAEGFESRKGPDYGDRDGETGNYRGAEVLQEEQDDKEYQHQRLDERDNDLFY